MLEFASGRYDNSRRQPACQFCAITWERAGPRCARRQPAGPEMVAEPEMRRTGRERTAA